MRADFARFAHHKSLVARTPYVDKVFVMNDISLREWDRPVNGLGNGNSGKRNEGSPAVSAFEGDTEDSIPETHLPPIAPGGIDSEQQELQFKARHIQMMALGSAPYLFH